MKFELRVRDVELIRDVSKYLQFKCDLLFEEDKKELDVDVILLKGDNSIKTTEEIERELQETVKHKVKELMDIENTYSFRYYRGNIYELDI